MEDPEDGVSSHTPTGPLAGAPRPTFSPGELLADRFRILRFVGHGGMGEVYEAEDAELQCRVALKTIRPEIAADLRGLERFKREVQLARKVTHAHVCRVFDVFSHGGTRFLTMEFLEGETLHAFLKRHGPMGTGEALPLVRGMVAALEAAHAAGVVHRDFKTENVMLVPSSEGAVRPVVTDFGLARLPSQTPDSTSGLSSSGQLVGTPQYMAPEQLSGGAVTPATDIYTLGVVMYEMVTGRLPFAGDTVLSAAVKRLTEPPASPRRHVPSLATRWEAVILRCLERSPAARFASVGDVLRALEGDREAWSRSAARRQRLIAVVGLLAITLLAGVVGYQARLLRRRPPVAAPGEEPVSPVSGGRRAVAILGFRNLSGRPDAAWLSTALAEMLTTELAAGGKLRTISGENVARMKVELSLPDSESLAKDTLARVRQNLGTDLVVLGSFLALGGTGDARIRLDLRLQDAASGETIAAVTETGSESKLLELVSSVGTRLREDLGVGTLSAAEARGAHAALPSGPESARLYSEGLVRLREFDALAARDLLTKAVAADPKSPLAHSALAQAWSVLGYETRAAEEAKKAYDLSGGLGREERLAVEARYREIAREWDKAIELDRTLWSFFPDNLEYGLRLAEAQRLAGQDQSALTTLEVLRKLPAPASLDPRIDLVEADAAEERGDLARARDAAGRAIRRGTELGARLIVARARIAEARALRSLGDFDSALAACEDARRIYAEAGDRSGVARALVETAGQLRYRGELDAALKAAREALAIGREIGDQTSAVWAMNRVASVLAAQGHLAEARKAYGETVPVWREVGNRTQEGTATNNIGEVLWRQGQLASAGKTLEDTLALFRGIGYERGLAFTSRNLGDVLYERGDLPGAKAMFEQALLVSRRIAFKSITAQAWSGLAGIALATGDLAEARKGQEQALAIHSETKQKGFEAETLLALAEALVESGHPDLAEARLRGALAEFESEKAVPFQALAQALLSGSLVAQGKLGEARSAMDRAQALSGGLEYRGFRLRIALERARLLVAVEQPAEAVKLLRSTLAETQAGGYRGLGLETRLALGEIETRLGDRIAGRRALESLAREARAAGFTLIARKADAARAAWGPS